MGFVPDKSAFLHEWKAFLRRWNAFLRCGKGVRTLWKEGRYPVERGSAPCGKRVGTLWKREKTLWKEGRYPVEMGSAPCGNGLINCFFLFQPLTDPLPTCTILSQTAEKYDSKMFIRSKINGQSHKSWPFP